MMKTLLLGMTGLCAGGAAWYMSDSPDFDRVVKKSPAQVYAAFSRLAQQGTVTPPSQDGKGPRISFRVDKVQDRSIHYEVLFDQRPVVTADLAFAAAGEDGRQTRMTGELDLDTAALGAGFQTNQGVALSMLQGRIIDAEFARYMDHMVDEVEAGHPLPALGTASLGVRESPGALEADPRYRRARAAAQQHAASRPMSSARPMVDPNRAADRYLNGGDRNGGWGR